MASKKKKRSSPKLRVIFRPKFEIPRFFPPKIRWSPPKKKRSSPKLRVVFRPKSEIQRFFPPKIRWSPKKKKKKVFTEIETDFSSNFANSDVWEGLFSYGGGLFSVFHKHSASKAQKTCNFAYFTSQWGGARAPPPPLETLLVTNTHPCNRFSIAIISPLIIAITITSLRQNLKIIFVTALTKSESILHFCCNLPCILFCIINIIKLLLKLQSCMCCTCILFCSWSTVPSHDRVYTLISSFTLLLGSGSLAYSSSQPWLDYLQFVDYDRL